MTSLSIRLNKRITIQQQSATQDDAGQPINTWVDVATLWAEIRDVSGREFIAADGQQKQVQTKILIRHREGIESQMRVLHGSNTYNIEAVLGQDNRTLLLMCSRGANNG